MSLWEEEISCPRCGHTLAVDSIREHKDGRKRLCWECKSCNISVTDRGLKLES